VNIGTSSDHFVIGRRHQASTRVVFFIVGIAMATWAPLVPYVKARTAAGNDVLGLLLLCFGVGSMLTMPLAAALSARRGVRRVVVLSTLVIVVALPLLATLSDFVSLAIVLLAFGAAIGSLDVAMNIQAIIVERASGRSMMSGFHGLFSVGGIAGAAGMTALLGIGAAPFQATLCIVAIIAIALTMTLSSVLPFGSKREGPLFALPRGIVLLIAAICFALFLTEGAVLDWSAVYLTTERGMDAAHSGLGYAAFAIAMTIGRLTGDRIVARLGGVKIIVLGSLCAAAGIALATFVEVWQVGVGAFALVGIGCSNIVPVLYTAAGRQTAMPESAAVAATTTVGYAGILCGPAAIGFVAGATSLSTAFLMLAALLLAVAATGRKLRV
jgi:predicted MFS family arabinose efflux permease